MVRVVRVVTVLVGVSSLAAGCADVNPIQRNQLASDIEVACSAAGGSPSQVVFTDAQGSYALALANAAHTDTLQEIDGVGPKIADRIIGARPFVTLADIDAVPYVGAGVLTGFRDHADVAVVLDWANTATTSELTAVCRIGSKTAEAIERARPIASLDELLAVDNIGDHTLKSLLGVDGYGCTTKGSVIDEWCGDDGVACYCVDAGDDPVGFVLDEDAASNWAEEAAGSWYSDNADYAWEEYCQFSYDHELPYDESDVMRFCDQFFIERYVQASIDAAIALAGTVYPDEAAAQRAIVDLVEALFLAPTWMADFEQALIDYMNSL